MSKYCPILSINSKDSYESCIEEKCEWWDFYSKRCSIHQITKELMYMSTIDTNLSRINNNIRWK